MCEMHLPSGHAVHIKVPFMGTKAVIAQVALLDKRRRCMTQARAWVAGILAVFKQHWPCAEEATEVPTAITAPRERGTQRNSAT